MTRVLHYLAMHLLLTKNMTKLSIDCIFNYCLNLLFNNYYPFSLKNCNVNGSEGSCAASLTVGLIWHEQEELVEIVSAGGATDASTNNGCNV